MTMKVLSLLVLDNKKNKMNLFRDNHSIVKVQER